MFDNSKCQTQGWTFSSIDVKKLVKDESRSESPSNDYKDRRLGRRRTN